MKQTKKLEALILEGYKPLPDMSHKEYMIMSKENACIVYDMNKDKVLFKNVYDKKFEYGKMEEHKRKE